VVVVEVELDVDVDVEVEVVVGLTVVGGVVVAGVVVVVRGGLVGGRQALAAALTMNIPATTAHAYRWLARIVPPPGRNRNLAPMF
jgi:hypothetical protein